MPDLRSRRWLTGSRLRDSGAVGTRRRAKECWHFLASAGAPQGESPGPQRVSLPFEGHGPTERAVTPQRRRRARSGRAHPRWMTIRHSDRHAPGRTQERHLRSKIRWFTEFCNSHYLSQLAAFFIDAWAKRSTVKSCLLHFFQAWEAGASARSDVKTRTVIRKTRAGQAKRPRGPSSLASDRHLTARADPWIWLGTVHRADNGVVAWMWLSVMILPQVHLRKPCYDFYFL